MADDLDFYNSRPSYYYPTPRYYTTYVPSCLVRDRYHNAFRFYRPLHISNSTNSRARAYLPFNIPDYSTTPISRMLSLDEPETTRYDYTYGADFHSATQDIRAKASTLLRDIQSPSVRHTRASSFEPAYNNDLDYNAVKRIVTRSRLMSEQPGAIKSIKYYY